MNALAIKSPLPARSPHEHGDCATGSCGPRKRRARERGCSAQSSTPSPYDAARPPSTRHLVFRERVLGNQRSDVTSVDVGLPKLRDLNNAKLAHDLLSRVFL